MSGAATDYDALGFSISCDTNSRICHCVGPQRGQPVCPCRMSALTIKDGRYVETIDHGPAPTPSDKEQTE